MPEICSCLNQNLWTSPGHSWIGSETHYIIVSAQHSERGRVSSGVGVVDPFRGQSMNDQQFQHFESKIVNKFPMMICINRCQKNKSIMNHKNCDSSLQQEKSDNISFQKSFSLYSLT